MKYFILSILGAALVSIVGNMIYFTVTHEYHAFEMTKAQPLMSLIMLNHLVYAGMMVYLYPHFAMNVQNHQKKGWWFGVCMGIIVFVPSGLITRGAWEVPITFFFPIDIVFVALLSGLMGVVIGRIYKMTSIAKE